MYTRLNNGFIFDKSNHAERNWKLKQNILAILQTIMISFDKHFTAHGKKYNLKIAWKEFWN